MTSGPLPKPGPSGRDAPTSQSHEPRFKPLDFGGDASTSITGSLDADGCIIALNWYHPQHGYVTLTSAAPFPEAERYNPAAVRAYRASLMTLDGFGFRSGLPVRARHFEPLPAPAVHLEYLSDDASLHTQLAVTTDGVYQRWQMTGGTPIWSGRLALMRCAYTQLTEGGPLPMPPLQMQLGFRDGMLWIENAALGCAVVISGFPAGEAWERSATEPVEVRIIAPDTSPLTLCYRVGTSAQALMQEAAADQTDVTGLIREQQAVWKHKLAAVGSDMLLQRGLSYSLMLAVPVGEGTCLLTDHMLLPLAWNRDAYYLARALLAWPGNEAEGAAVVRRHLIWTFEQAERIGGAWARCYLANGRVKDAAFQLDQQLFPLLELCDYLIVTGDRTILMRLGEQIEQVIGGLMARRMPDRMLFPTDETPADDPIALPYHASSHILFWRVLTRLEQAGITGDWLPLADALRAEIDRTFIAQVDGEPLYAYASDGAGRHHLYHDANDLPLALAPLWGFCPPDSAVWRATVDFAFSRNNAGGWYEGRLGSVHTRAPWPLGDIQDWIVAQITGDMGRADRAIQQLQRVASLDGALTEAYDSQTGAVVSRGWFAWPNAAYACAALGVFDQ